MGIEHARAFVEKMKSDAGSVKANTNYVVIGTDSASKADKAKQWDVKTLSETALPDWKVVKKGSI